MGLQKEGLISEESYNWNKKPFENARAVAVLIEIGLPFIGFYTNSKQEKITRRGLVSKGTYR